MLGPAESAGRKESGLQAQTTESEDPRARAASKRTLSIGPLVFVPLPALATPIMPRYLPMLHVKLLHDTNSNSPGSRSSKVEGE